MAFTLKTFFAIDNSTPGKAPSPDQVNYTIICLPALDFELPAADWVPPDWVGMTIQDFYNWSPEDLILNFGTVDCDKGNIAIK